MTSRAREPRTDRRAATQRRTAQRRLAPKAMDEKTFPRAVRTAWKDAIAAGHEVKASYAVGPWLGVDLIEVLEPECPSLALWIVRPDGAHLRALWLRRWKTVEGQRVRAWSFQSAFQSQPEPLLLNATEMKEWING